jgi:DNA-binding NarL/FixJ family response regulator
MVAGGVVAIDEGPSARQRVAGVEGQPRGDRRGELGGIYQLAVGCGRRDNLGRSIIVLVRRRRPDRIQIAVVDDHPLFREGVANTLAASPNIDVVGQGETAEDAIRLAGDLLPGILLLDISMKGGGINAAREISTAYPVVKIVMLTVSEREEDVAASLKAGARGYILKGVTARELVRVIESIHAGESYVTPGLAASLLTEWRGRPDGTTPSADPLSELTGRERQILELLATGSSNKEIAREIDLSEKTVKHYMTNILQKLQVRNRVEAALLAQKVAHKQV